MSALVRVRVRSSTQLVYLVCVVGSSECDEAVMADVNLCVVFVAP